MIKLENKQRLPARAAPTPTTETELMTRARELTGMSIGTLAARFGVAINPNPAQTKGLMGQLLECALGADAKSRSEPDFLQLGIELKTIPVNNLGKPQESTYLCVAPTVVTPGLQFIDSPVFRKLQHILWFPIVISEQGVAGHCLGTPFLWQPTVEQLTVLRCDWEEHIERISLGEINQISAHAGVYLQIRPKAANNSARRVGISADGTLVTTLPRGFYLRSRFTTQILQDYFW
jgi:DNA mismatch repair protein MutH